MQQVFEQLLPHCRIYPCFFSLNSLIHLAKHWINNLTPQYTVPSHISQSSDVCHARHSNMKRTPLLRGCYPAFLQHALPIVSIQPLPPSVYWVRRWVGRVHDSSYPATHRSKYAFLEYLEFLQVLLEYGLSFMSVEDHVCCTCLLKVLM